LQSALRQTRGGEQGDRKGILHQSNQKTVDVCRSHRERPLTCWWSTLLAPAGLNSLHCACGEGAVSHSHKPPMLMLPLNQQQPTIVVASKMFEGLLDDDFDLKPLPQLAESWEISEDGSTVG